MEQDDRLRRLLREIAVWMNETNSDASDEGKVMLRREIAAALGHPGFAQYRRKAIAELRPWRPGDDLTGVSVSAADIAAGSPREGDMIARNPTNHADQWLVAAAYFADNFEEVR